MAQTSAGHVFISYSRKDKAVMQRIAKLLQERGINVWVDNKELVPGTPSWEEEIEKAIRGASAVIVLLSPDAKKSRWVLSEVTFADRYNKRIFPVLVGGSEKTSIPLRLSTNQYVDIRQNEEAGLAALLTELTRFLKISNVTISEKKQKRILEAAIESEVTVGKSTQLVLLIRRLDSKGLISIIQSVDEEIVLDESNVKSKELEIEFPIEHGSVGSASLSVRLTAPDFSPPQQLKHIKIPPDGDSEVVTFIMVPRVAGRLILQLEVLARETSLTSRTVRTTAIESEETRKVKILYSTPIIILVEHSPPVPNKTNHTIKQRKRQWGIQYVVVPIVVAVIGLIGAIFSSPIFNRIFPADTLTPGSSSIPSSTVTPFPVIRPSVTFSLTPVCRPPAIQLNFVPRSINVNSDAKLTITNLEPDITYEVLSITAEKGEFPNGKEEPYLYLAPGLPDKDIVTVLVGDHECRTKEEIEITITQ